MEEIKFKKEFISMIRKGDKKQTMRIPPKRINVVKGDVVKAIIPVVKDHFIIKIDDVGYKSFKSINDEDAKLEGFNNAKELKDVLVSIYDDYNFIDSSRLYYYKFHLIEDNLMYYGDFYQEYLDMKINTVIKHKKITDSIKEFFSLNYPKLTVTSVRVNENHIVDQVLIEVPFHKLNMDVIGDFCSVFDLKLDRIVYKEELYRENKRKKYSYSFKSNGGLL